MVTELWEGKINVGMHDTQIEVQPDGTVKGRFWRLPPATLGKVSWGEWHHVALAYDAPSLKMLGYLDGKFTASATKERQYPAKLYYALGAEDSSHMGNGVPFNGLIDEFAVWNRALTKKEIVQRYNNGRGNRLTGKEEGLVLVMSFEDPSVLKRTVDLRKPKAFSKKHPNAKPAAVPAKGITATPGDKFTLDGSQSHDPDGQQIVAYHWYRQDERKRLHLIGHGKTFTVVAPTTPGKYKYALKVSDGILQSESEIVEVTVAATPESPTKPESPKKAPPTPAKDSKKTSPTPLQ